MRFRAKIVPFVVAGLPIAGCATSDGDTKSIAKTDTVAKPDPKQDPKQDPKKQDPIPDPKVPIVIQTPDDIPVALGGAPMPYEPPPPPPDTKEPPRPSPAPAPAAPAAAAAAAPAAPARPTAIALAHDHPPGEPCKPLTRAEVEKALADLKQ